MGPLVDGTHLLPVGGSDNVMVGSTVRRVLSVPATFQLLRIAILVLSLTLVQSPPAQPPAAQPAATQPPPDIVFHSTTRLVQVNVVAHDKDGKPVADLKKEDFSVTEKGKPQEIAFFSVDRSDKAPSDV